MSTRAASIVSEIRQLLELQSHATCDGRLSLRDLDIRAFQQYQLRELRISFLFAELEDEAFVRA
jgi:hypothetical protein